MRRVSTARSHGFSMLEMMIALGLGAMVLGASVELYTRGVNATFVISQRAEMQQDFRAASVILTKDIALAGSGLGNNVQIALPSGSGTVVPVYGCDQSSTCYINSTAVAYPYQLGSGGSKIPYLYGLMPGWKLGPTLNSLQGPTDVITVVYSDTNFLLSCYNVSVTSSTAVTFTLPSPLPATCVVPAPLTAPQAVNDPVVGLTPGDLVWFQLTTTSGSSTSSTAPVIAEVTNVSASGSTYNVTFNSGDPLHMNQPGATSGSLGNVGTTASNGTKGTGTRLLVISYYVDNTVNPPRLMRQISGHPPVPIVEGVQFLQFSYDLYNSATNSVLTDQSDGGASASMTPNQITKVNVKHMSMNSTLHGAKGYQGLDLQTSISTRDLTFKNNYPLGP